MVSRWRGVALTLYEEGAIGRSWRIGVDSDERTELVTTGPFALARTRSVCRAMPMATTRFEQVVSSPALAL